MSATAAPLSPNGVDGIGQVQGSGYASSIDDDDFVLVEDEGVLEIDEAMKETDTKKEKQENDKYKNNSEEETAPVSGSDPNDEDDGCITADEDNVDESVDSPTGLRKLYSSNNSPSRHLNRLGSSIISAGKKFDEQLRLSETRSALAETMEDFQRTVSLIENSYKENEARSKINRSASSCSTDPAEDSILVENDGTDAPPSKLVLKKRYSKNDVIVSIEVMLDRGVKNDVDIAEEAKEFIMETLQKKFPTSTKNKTNENDFLALDVLVNLATPENIDARKWNAGICNLTWLPIPEIRSARLGAVVSLTAPRKKRIFIGKQQFVKNGKHLHGMNDMKDDSDPDAVKNMSVELSDSIIKTVMMVLKCQHDFVR